MVNYIRTVRAVNATLYTYCTFINHYNHRKLHLRYILTVYLLNTWLRLNVLSTATGDRGSTVVKVLCYKSEGRWFDPS